MPAAKFVSARLESRFFFSFFFFGDRVCVFVGPRRAVRGLPQHLQPCCLSAEEQVCLLAAQRLLQV